MEGQCNAMTRRAFLGRAGAGIAGMALEGMLFRPSLGQPRKFNVLLIAVDDLSARLGCYGYSIVQSPNIDRLATRGVRFEHAYCQYPLCNPSRTSLLTGRYPTTTRVMDNLRHFRDEFPHWVTLPQHFRAHGYVTARVGKIFHGGLDDLPSWTEGGEPRVTRKPRTPAEQEQYRRTSDRWEAVKGEGEDQPDYLTASRAIELLEKYRDKPFFLAVGFVKPHSPLVAPKKYFNFYDPSKIPLPPDFAPKPTVGPGVPEEALSPNGDLFIGREATPEEARQMIAAYFACVSFMDAQVGRLLEALERWGLQENTIVVLFGDHGYHLGEKGKWSKHNSLYEVTARVPLIIRAPGVAQEGAVSPRTVELVDLYPTLVELCQLPMPEGLEGQSLVPLLRDPDAPWAHPAYTVTQRGKIFGRSIRTERYRYTEWDQEGRRAELYDHQTDPHEMRNLAGEPGYAALVKGLRELLAQMKPPAL